MNRTLLHGVVCPIATPLDDDESVDEASLRALVEHLVPDLDGVFALGSSGEYAVLGSDAAARVVESVVDQVAGRIPVFAGIGDTGTRRAVRNLGHLPGRGVDAVVVTSSFYYPLSDQAALARHFLAVAEASPLPVVLYNIPQNTATNLEPSTLGELARHPNVVGLKDSWGDMIQFQGYLEEAPPDFPVMQGREQLVAASLWMGASGVISAVANFAPGMIRQLAAAVAAGDRENAIAIQRRLSELARLFDERYWLSALKAAVAELGFGSSRPASPLPPLTDDERARVAERLRAAGVAPTGVHRRA